MFSASKVGGSRGSRSLLPGWHPLLHIFFIVPWRAFLVKRKFLVASTRGRLPLLFTEMPRREILGKWASGVWDSRKLNFYHYSSSETLYVGVVQYVVDRGCMYELPVNGVRGNRTSDNSHSRKPVCSFANRYALGPGLSAVSYPAGLGRQHNMYRV
jgi:hypothetical protein